MSIEGEAHFLTLAKGVYIQKFNPDFLRNFADLNQRACFMVWEINMRVCPRLQFDNIMHICCLGYDYYNYDAFDFLCNSIVNL